MSALFGDGEDNTADKLRHAGERRLLFDPRPLGGEPETGFDPLTEEQRRVGREKLAPRALAMVSRAAAQDRRG
jgi:hypothetical protein